MILGPAVWAHVKDDLRLVPRMWVDFKTFINDKFGISEEDLHDGFHAAVMKPGESVSSFIRRMEKLRKRLGISGVSAL